MLSIFIIIFILYILFLLKPKLYKEKEYSYYFPKKIFTKSELHFFNILSGNIDFSRFYLLSKVRIADFVDIKKTNYKEKNALFNRIKSKHIDFVIINTKWEVLALIELDWNSNRHNKNTIKNDIFKNELFQSLGIKFFRFKNWETNVSNLKIFLETEKD